MTDQQRPLLPTQPTDAQIAVYIAELFRTINYLLDMARAEAEKVARGEAERALPDEA